jgi:hypothetical protein
VDRQKEQIAHELHVITPTHLRKAEPELWLKVGDDGEKRRRRILDGSSGIINLLQGVNTP